MKKKTHTAIYLKGTHTHTHTHRAICQLGLIELNTIIISTSKLSKELKWKYPNANTDTINNFLFSPIIKYKPILGLEYTENMHQKIPELSINKWYRKIEDRQIKSRLAQHMKHKVQRKDSEGGLN